MKGKKIPSLPADAPTVASDTPTVPGNTRSPGPTPVVNFRLQLSISHLDPPDSNPSVTDPTVEDLPTHEPDYYQMLNGSNHSLTM